MRVIARMEYEQETDRLVGFVLTLGNEDLPISDSFIAVSFKAIQDAFLTASYAKYAFVYMAQSYTAYTTNNILHIFCLFSPVWQSAAQVVTVHTFSESVGPAVSLPASIIGTFICSFLKRY